MKNPAGVGETYGVRREERGKSIGVSVLLVRDFTYFVHFAYYQVRTVWHGAFILIVALRSFRYFYRPVIR